MNIDEKVGRIHENLKGEFFHTKRYMITTPAEYSDPGPGSAADAEPKSCRNAGIDWMPHAIYGRQIHVITRACSVGGKKTNPEDLSMNIYN